MLESIANVREYGKIIFFSFSFARVLNEMKHAMRRCASILLFVFVSVSVVSVLLFFIIFFFIYFHANFDSPRKQRSMSSLTCTIGVKSFFFIIIQFEINSISILRIRNICILAEMSSFNKSIKLQFVILSILDQCVELIVYLLIFGFNIQSQLFHIVQQLALLLVHIDFHVLNDGAYISRGFFHLPF